MIFLIYANNTANYAFFAFFSDDQEMNKAKIRFPSGLIIIIFGTIITSLALMGILIGYTIHKYDKNAFIR